MDLLQCLCCGVAHNPFFKEFHLLSQLFEDGEIVVHNSIDQRVSEIIRSHFPYPAFIAPDAVPDGAEDVSLDPLLEGKYEIGADDKTDLLGYRAAVLVIVTEHF